MSLLSVSEARGAGLGRGLSDADLQSRINGVEGQLARKIGQLVGPRTTVWPAGRRVWLPRPWKASPAPVVEADGTPLVADTDYVLQLQGQLYLSAGYPTVSAIAVTWEPDDVDAVRDALIQLLGLSLQPFQSESIGDYSYARGGQKMLQRTRDEIYASLVYGAGTGL